MLCTGNEESDIIIIAQNPGEIKGESWRNLLANEMNKAPQTQECGALMKSLYRLDFESSHGYDVMSKVFGEHWLDDWLYTNAVRCRTKGNAVPSQAMIDTCDTWTRILTTRRKARCVVFIGSIATGQFLGDAAKYVGVGVPKRHPKTRAIMLALPHYVKWHGDDFSTYEQLIKRIKDMKSES
jgi:uracil-DNA glycosylase